VVPRPNYIEYRLGSQSAYVRADKLKEIREVDVIVFDCDGVLIDVSESIRKAKGFVGKGRVLIADKALDWLETLIGGPRFGVASGSLANTARHVLGDTLDRFDPAAQVWHDEVEAAERETGASLRKPSPYPLLRASEPFKPYSRVLYVGDTVADWLMAENAGGGFLFAGVASNEETRSGLLDAGGAMVLASVNLLPTVLRLLK
jgi:phosphoglycolate phosphatase-like HAD superfamily hydrolase